MIDISSFDIFKTLLIRLSYGGKLISFCKIYLNEIYGYADEYAK